MKKNGGTMKEIIEEYGGLVLGMSGAIGMISIILGAFFANGGILEMIEEILLRAC